MFADMEPIGISTYYRDWRRKPDNDDIEYKYRRSGEKSLIKNRRYR